MLGGDWFLTFFEGFYFTGQGEGKEKVFAVAEKSLLKSHFMSYNLLSKAKNKILLKIV